MGRGELRW